MLAIECLIRALSIAMVWLLGRALGLALPLPGAQFFTVIMAVLVVPISLSGWALRGARPGLARWHLRRRGGKSVGFLGVLRPHSVCFGLMVTAGCLPGALAWLMTVRRPAECDS
jgi:hypothetical protein